jgi:hypothetical protein
MPQSPAASGGLSREERLIRWIGRNGSSGGGNKAAPPATLPFETTSRNFDGQSGPGAERRHARSRPVLSGVMRNVVHNASALVQSLAVGSGAPPDRESHRQPDPNGEQAERARAGGSPANSPLRGRGDLELEWLSACHRYVIAARKHREESGDTPSTR